MTTTDLAPRPGLPGDLLPNGYVLPPGLPFEDLVGIRDLAEHIVEASPWWLADVVAEMQARYPDDYVQSLPTREADPQGIRQSRLKQAEWMADRWPRGTRVTGMSYTHHRVVAKLDRDEARTLLATAAEQDWSTRDLAREVEDRHAAIRAEAMVGASPSCLADAPWVPTLDDLLPEVRRVLEAAAPDGEIARAWFIEGALWGWVHARESGLFARWRGDE